MKGAKPGAKARTPKGFENKLSFFGKTITIKYYLSIKDSTKNNLKIDACFSPGKEELWVVTRGRTKTYIADSILHEMLHYIFQYLAEDNLAMSDEMEERIILLLEAGTPALLRSNPWFHSLFGETQT